MCLKRDTDIGFTSPSVVVFFSKSVVVFFPFLFLVSSRTLSHVYLYGGLQVEVWTNCLFVFF